MVLASTHKSSVGTKTKKLNKAEGRAELVDDCPSRDWSGIGVHERCQQGNNSIAVLLAGLKRLPLYHICSQGRPF